jgi:hypothetical protein
MPPCRACTLGDRTRHHVAPLHVEHQSSHSTDRQVDRRTDGRTDRQTDGRTDGQTDRRTEMVPGSMRCPGKMDRQMDRQTDAPRWCPALCAAQGRWTGRWTDRQAYRDGARLYALPREDALLEFLHRVQRSRRWTHHIRHRLRSPPVIPLVARDPGHRRIDTMLQRCLCSRYPCMHSCTHSQNGEDGSTGQFSLVLGCMVRLSVHPSVQLTWRLRGAPGSAVAPCGLPPSPSRRFPGSAPSCCGAARQAHPTRQTDRQTDGTGKRGGPARPLPARQTDRAFTATALRACGW